MADLYIDPLISRFLKQGSFIGNSNRAYSNFVIRSLVQRSNSNLNIPKLVTKAIECIKLERVLKLVTEAIECIKLERVLVKHTKRMVSLSS